MTYVIELETVNSGWSVCTVQAPAKGTWIVNYSFYTNPLIASGVNTHWAWLALEFFGIASASGAFPVDSRLTAFSVSKTLGRRAKF